MDYYRIISLAVQGKRKKPFASPEVMPEDQFIDGSIPELVKSGHIKKVSGNNVIKDTDEYRKFQELSEEYKALTGQEKVNGRWGITKLNEEVSRIKMENAVAAYKTATGEDPKPDWDYGTITSRLEAQALENAAKDYKELFGEDPPANLDSEAVGKLIQEKIDSK